MLLGLCVATACSSESRGLDVDASPMERDGRGAPIDGSAAGDSSALSDVSITNITPRNAAYRINQLTRVTIQLSGPVDAASITRQSVTLSQRPLYASFVVHSDVSYDASTHIITLVPRAPLVAGSDYDVRVAGVTAGGLAVAEASSVFRVLHNPIESTTSLDATGRGTSRIEYQYDVGGTPTDEIIIRPGVDGVFGTGDDQSDGWIAMIFPTNSTRRTTTYIGAGADNRWRNGDDVIGKYHEAAYRHPDTTREVFYSDAGSDGRWFTADDRVSEIKDATHAGPTIRFVTTSAGPDGLASTGDDAIRLWSDFVHPSFDDTELLQVFHDGPGPDGAWLTADDRSAAYDRRRYDTRGLLVAWTSHGNGADGQPNTADDTTTARSSYEYDAQGQQTRWVRYAGPGSDGAWGTDDDPVLEYDDHTFEDGRLIASANFVVGPDGQPFTDDDVKRSTSRYRPFL